MKTFAHSLAIYICVVLGTFLIVLPLYPSDISVLILLSATFVFIFRTGLRIGEYKQDRKISWLLFRRILVVTLLCLIILAVTITVLILSSSPFGPLILTTSILYCFSLGMSNRPVSIFSGWLIYMSLYTTTYVIFKWYAGFLFAYEMLLATPLFLISAALIRTVSISGIDEGTKRTLWKSLFPVAAGWARKGRTALIGCLLFTNTALLIYTYDHSSNRLSIVRAQLTKLEREVMSVKNRSENLEKLEMDIEEADRRLDLASHRIGLEVRHEEWWRKIKGYAENENLAVINSKYDESESEWRNREFYASKPVRHRMTIIGKRAGIWRFMIDNLCSPGSGCIRSFTVRNLRNGDALGDIIWDGYLFSFNTGNEPNTTE